MTQPVRIGKVRFKSGGSLTLLKRPEKLNEVEQHMRAWFNIQLGENDSDAYVAVAFRVNPETPGRLDYSVGICSRNDALALPLLGKLAGAYIEREISVSRARDLTLEDLGMSSDPWEPDEAS